MALTAEHWRRVSNTVRGVTAVLLATAPGAFESPKNFGRNLQNPFSVFTAEAGELQSPLEQLAIYNEALQRYSTLLAKKDLAGLEKYSPGDSNFSWKSAGTEPLKYRSKAEFLGLLRQALVRSEPKCIGYVQSRRATEYRILFQNFSLGNHPDASGYSYIVLGIVPFENSVSSVLRGVEEVAKKDLETAKSTVTPCGVKTPAVPKPEIPPELAKTKVVYLAGEGKQVQGAFYDRKNLYIANLDGTEEKQLTDDNNQKRDLKFFPNGKEVIYVESDKDAKNGGIIKLNIETGEKEYLTQTPRDFCPSPDVDGSLKFHKMEGGDRFGESFENVYSIDLKTKKVEQITNDKIGSSEACPTPSPDGELIAISTNVFASHGRYPGGIAIYQKNELKNFDPGRLPPLIDGATPLFWSPDSKWLYFRNWERKEGGPMTYSLHRVFVETGRVEDLPITNIIGASIAPKGEWVISIHLLGKGSASIMAHNLLRKEISRQLFTRDSYTFYDIAVQPKVFVPEKNTIVLFPGLGSVIKNGKYTGGVFDNLVEIFKYEMGYKDENILLASLGGSTFDSQGRYTPKDQDCTDTLRDQDTNGTAVAQLLRDNTRLHPNDQLTLITHSLGSIGTLRGLEQLLNDNSGFDFSRIKLIVTHGPNLGIDKPAWQYLFSPFRIFDLPPDCNLDLALFKLPFPTEINYPALVELKEMWERLPQTTKDRASLTARLTARGAKVYALGSFQDCVMDALACYMPDFLSEIKMLTNPGKFTSLTQELPGAVNIMRHLGHRGIFGHDTFLNTEEGQAIIATLVGRQLKAGN